MNYRIFPPEEMIEATIELPLSKSISNRALIINALTADTKPIAKVAHCDDTDVMVEALSSQSSDVNIGAAGTAMRFLTAYFSVQEGRAVTLDGSERMRQRPIKALVDALRDCGASIEYLGEEGFPPLKISGRKLQGGDVALPASISSQYISALLMIAPLMAQGLRLTLEGEIMSRPYILMTLEMMRRQGVESEFDDNIITIAPSEYRYADIDVEADWSAASYWYEIAALSTGMVSLKGLKSPSLQGDSKIAGYFEHLGIDTQFSDGEVMLEPSPEQDARLELDMSEQPDLVQALAVTCCMLRIPFRFTGVETLRIKETDRLEALRVELDKLSFDLSIEGDNAIAWYGGQHPIIEQPCIDTYKDHRMAMAFAPVALYLPGVIINDVEVVSKSYPDYWEHLAQTGFVIVDADAEIPEDTEMAE